MAFVPGFKLLGRLCEVFGIDPKKTPVKRITIDVPANGVAEVVVYRFIDADAVDGILGTVGDEGFVKFVRIEPRIEAPPDSPDFAKTK